MNENLTINFEYSSCFIYIIHSHFPATMASTRYNLLLLLVIIISADSMLLYNNPERLIYKNFIKISTVMAKFP